MTNTTAASAAAAALHRANNIRDASAAALELSTAETIGALFNNDGQQHDTAEGQTIDEVCRAAAPNPEREGEKTRYEFADGSSIIVTMEAWDYGLPGECFCFEGGGHSDYCLDGGAW